MWQKIWDWLNGNKTLLGTLILVIVEQEGDLFGNALIEEVALWLGGLLAGTGVVHKFIKGTNNT
jgi:hypothetical protein